MVPQAPEKPKLGPPIDIFEIALFGPGRYRYWLVPCGVIGLVVGFCMALLQPSSYVSQAKMYITWGEREVFNAEKLIKGAGGGGGGGPRGGGFGMADELQLIRNSEFYEKIAREVGPARLLEPWDPLRHDTPSTPRLERWQHQLQDWYFNRGRERNPEARPRPMDLESQAGVAAARMLISAGLTMRGVRGDRNQLTISYRARSPELAQDVVQAAVKVTLQRHYEIFDERFNADFVRDQMQQAEHEFRVASEEYYKHQQDCGFYNISQQEAQLLKQRINLQNQISQSIITLGEIQKELEYIDEQLEITPEVTTIESEPTLGRNPIFTQHEKRLEQLAAQLSQLETTYKPNSPGYEEAKEALETQIALAEKSLEASPPMILRGHDYEYEGPNQEYYELVKRKEELELRREVILDGQERYRTQLATVGQSMDALVACQPRHEDMREIITKARARAGQFNRALEKRESAKLMDVDESMGNIWVMNQPSYNPGRGRTGRTETVLMGLGVGLGIGVGLAILRQLLDQRMRYPGAVQRVLGAPVLGVVPEQRAWRRITKRLRKQAVATA